MKKTPQIELHIFQIVITDVLPIINDISISFTFSRKMESLTKRQNYHQQKNKSK